MHFFNFMIEGEQQRLTKHDFYWYFINFMFVIMDGFHLFVSYPSWFNCLSTTASITKNDLVWNFLVLKGTGSVPFLHASKNWNNSNSNWRSPDLDWIDSDKFDKKCGNGIKEETKKNEMTAAKLHNQHE